MYLYRYLRLQEQLFRIGCDPSVPSVGTRGAVACTQLGLVWSSTSATTRAHSPPWHRRLRAKLRRFVKRLRQQPTLSPRQCLRGARAVTFLSGHHSLPNYSRTGWDCSPGWSRDRRHTDVMESKLEWNWDDPREATVVKTSPPRRLQSSLPTAMQRFLPRARHHPLAHCLRKWRLYFKLWHQKMRILHHGWTGCCRTRTRKICVWNSARSTLFGNVNKKWNAKSKRWPSANCKCNSS